MDEDYPVLLNVVYCSIVVVSYSPFVWPLTPKIDMATWAFLKFDM